MRTDILNNHWKIGWEHPSYSGSKCNVREILAQSWHYRDRETESSNRGLSSSSNSSEFCTVPKRAQEPLILTSSKNLALFGSLYFLCIQMSKVGTSTFVLLVREWWEIIKSAETPGSATVFRKVYSYYTCSCECLTASDKDTKAVSTIHLYLEWPSGYLVSRVYPCSVPSLLKLSMHFRTRQLYCLLPPTTSHSKGEIDTVTLVVFTVLHRV